MSQQLQKLKQNEFRANDILDDGEVYGVKNPERREQKLKETMSEEKEPKPKTTITKRVNVNKEEKLFVGTEYSGRCQVCSKVIFKKDGSRYFEATNLLNTGHLEEDYLAGLSTGWNTLCLCPNCAAEFKYGAVSLYDFEDKVATTEIERNYDEFYDFVIEMQGEERVLHYTPKHLMALQTALEYFKEHKEVDAMEENEQVNSLSKDNIHVENKTKDTITEVIVVNAGDKCPNCKTTNAKVQNFSVLDLNGKIQVVEGRICSCGTKYLTHKQKKKLGPEIPVKIVEGTLLNNKLLNKKNILSSPKIVAPTRNRERCPKCGATGLFSSTGMCWHCYKEEMSSRYE